MSEVMHHQGSEFQGIHLSEAAKTHFIKCIAGIDGCIGVRLSVKKSGCSGYSYEVNYIDHLEALDEVQRFENDLIVGIAKSSLPFLSGIKIDYVKQGLNSKLTFSNPNQTGVCGCGESFTV